ncbi:MAG: transglycosylase SLT domain-containing protein [Acidobacteria bacterium]|nr:transglycosylase SLT domain-containing protein [Acidobacteriota bacterium]MCW5966979.1 transglycosylase SLT domain-containing protein [Blastocatellales bacterium]
MKFSAARSLLLLPVVFLAFPLISAAQTRQSPLVRAMARDDLAVAENLLREAARSSPTAFIRDNQDYLLARVLLRRGSNRDAQRYFQQVITRKSPLAPYALWHSAELERASGNVAAEQELLTRLLSDHPQFLRRDAARARLAASLLKSRKYQQAIAVLRPIAGVRGGTAREALARIGEAQLALNDMTAARATFDSLLASGASDDGALRAILGLDRIDEIQKVTIGEAERLRRARIYHFNRSFADARRHWLSIVNDFPQSTRRAEALFHLGRGYFLEDNFQEAIRWYERAYAEFPITEEGEQGFYYVGHSHQALNDADRAVARYDDFLKKYPRSKYFGYAYLNAIDTLRSAGRYDEALKWTARAQTEARDPYIAARALFDSAKIRLTQGNLTGALADLDALRARPIGRGLVATTNPAEIAFMRAMCLEKLGRFDDAVIAYLALPELRDGPGGYYGAQAGERLRALGAGTRTRRFAASHLDRFLKDARAAHSAGNAQTAKTAASQALRLLDEKDSAATREEMLRILSASYAKLPAYKLPAFERMPLGVAGSQLAAALIDLGLYDEGASELAAARPSGSGAAARNWTYTLAWYCARGDCADRTIKFSEPILNSLPGDYRAELLPKELAEIFYPLPFRESLLRHAASRGVDPRFVLSIARQESRYDPRVKSAAAARGLLQFISSTSSRIADQLGLADFDQSDLYQPDAAILIGAQYMKNLFDEFGTPQAVAAAYNGSEDSVRRWIARARTPEVDRFTIEAAKRETKDYVFHVLNYYRAYRAIYPDFGGEKQR